MDPERWRAVRAAFDELVELGAGERAERLATLGAADPELCRGVEALLLADAEAEGRLAGLMFGSIAPGHSPDAPLPGQQVSADPLNLVGRTLSHFRVLEPLGAGGMGVVYSAEDTRLNRLVALKLPLPGHRLDDSAKERFLHEARSAGALDHANLCGIYEVGESEDGLLFMAMVLYPGETLKARLAREGPLPVDLSVEIARQITQGLAAAHQAGIVHRDLKPGNVMLLPDGTVKILDFGLAKVRDLSLTGPGTLMGTAAYMAPEQVRGDPVDTRADLWALGVVLYEMLTGRQPFRGEHEVSIAHAIVHEEPARPSELRGEIPPPLQDAVLTLLGKDPLSRYATAQEAGSDLSAIQRGHPLPSGRRPAGESSAFQGRPRSKRRTVRRTLAVAIGALLVVGGALGAYRSLRPEPAGFEPNLLAVVPFDVPDSSLQLWHEGLVDILSSDLDGAGPLRTVPQSVVLGRWSGRSDRASAARLGERTGAELVVFGHLVRRGTDSVGLRAAVLDRSRGVTLQGLDVVGEEGRMAELADSLGVQILRTVGQGRPVGSVREATLSARSLPALKEFLRGEQFYRRGLWDSAAPHYDRAIAREADFALALRRMAQVIGWGVANKHGYGTWAEYLGRAIVLNRGLAPRDSFLLLADSLRVATATPTDPDALIRNFYRAIAVLEAGTQQHPRDPEMWHALGEVRHHSPPPLYQPERALEAFDRAIALDPGFGPAYEHTVTLALELRRSDRAADYARTGGALASGTQPSVLRLAALVLDSGAESSTVTRALAAAPLKALWIVGMQCLPWATDSGEATIAVLRELLSEGHDEVGAGRFVTDPIIRPLNLAWGLAFRGHLRAAADLSTASYTDPRATGAASLVDPFPELALFGAVPDSLARGAFNSAFTSNLEWGLSPGPTAPRHLRGAPWWLARRDTAALHRFAARAARIARGPGSPVAVLRARYFDAAATAYLTLARGDSARAARLLEAIPDTLCIVAPCFYEKVTLARVLAASGEDRAAGQILDRWSLAAGSTPSAVLAALERARIAERLGDTATARDRYRFVAEAWRHADPELQPYAAEARAAGARLKNSR